MNFIVRILPVIVGYIIWRKTGNIIVGAVIASIFETFLGSIFGKKPE